MSEEENPFARLERLSKESNDRIKENTLALNKLNAVMMFHRGQGDTSQQTQLSQGHIHELKTQTDILRKILEKANGGGGRPGMPGGDGAGGGGFPTGFKAAFAWSDIGQKLMKVFTPLANFFKPILSTVKNLGSKIWGGLKKSGLLPGVFMGVGIAVGAVIAKVLQASPLLQSMMKILNMGIILMLRPIGDFIGSVLRPTMIYFIKDVAVPFFQASKSIMKDGGKIGKGLLGFFIQPIETIGAAIIRALMHFPLLGAGLGKDVKQGAQLMFEDPARAFRYNKQIGEFKHGGSMYPTDIEWMNMGLKMPEERPEQIEFYKSMGMTDEQIAAKGRPASAAWIMEQRTKDPLMIEHYTTQAWKKLEKYRNALHDRGLTIGAGGSFQTYPGDVGNWDFGGQGVGGDAKIATVDPEDVTTMGGGYDSMLQDFWDWLTGASDAGEDNTQVIEDNTDVLEDW